MPKLTNYFKMRVLETFYTNNRYFCGQKYQLFVHNTLIEAKIYHVFIPHVRRQAWPSLSYEQKRFPHPQTKEAHVEISIDDFLLRGQVLPFPEYLDLHAQGYDHWLLVHTGLTSQL